MAVHELARTPASTQPVEPAGTVEVTWQVNERARLTLTFEWKEAERPGAQAHPAAGFARG